MSDLPLPLRVHEGQVDGEVYILGAEEEPVVRVYGYTVKESLKYGAALTRAANLQPHYARCVEALIAGARVMNVDNRHCWCSDHDTQRTSHTGFCYKARAALTALRAAEAAEPPTKETSR